MPSHKLFHGINLWIHFSYVAPYIVTRANQTHAMTLDFFLPLFFVRTHIKCVFLRFQCVCVCVCFGYAALVMFSTLLMFCSCFSNNNDNDSSSWKKSLEMFKLTHYARCSQFFSSYHGLDFSVNHHRIEMCLEHHFSRVHLTHAAIFFRWVIFTFVAVVCSAILRVFFFVSLASIH